jgi:F-type H+-transporting ATPase subunit c
MAVGGAVEGVSLNPGASGKILTTMMIGFAMIESLAIYALVVALIILYANPYKEVALKAMEHMAK